MCCSSAEVVLDWIDVQDELLYVLFRLSDQETVTLM